MLGGVLRKSALAALWALSVVGEFRKR